MISEHLVDEPLLRGTSVLELEGHDFIEKDASLHDEGGLFWLSGCMSFWL